MCGIAGIYNPEGVQQSQEVLMASMLGSLSHRGPDGEGIYRDDRIVLGHKRLAIIDLTSGDQPMATPDGSLWVCANGEVFNYIEIRRELMEKGHTFRTTCDIEVILHLYEEYGLDLFEHMNAQFSFALWDTRKKTLILARDRSGILPLFYSWVGSTFVFSSEVKAMQPLMGKFQLNPEGLAQVFTFWNVVAPTSIFEGIHQLRPGECMVVEESRSRTFLYWDMTFPRDGEHDIREEAPACALIRETLHDASAIRLRADVPVGAYLSGGLDSSILCLLVREHAPGMETFSVSFADEVYDESVFQESMARSLGTRHHVKRITPGDIAQSFPRVIQHAENPVLRTAPAPMFMLSWLARRHGIKVVLTGEGADELFGGYDLFKEAKIRRFWSRFPASRLRPSLLFRLYPYAPVQMKRSGALLLSFYRKDLSPSGHFAYSHLPTWRNTASIQAFFSSAFREAVGSYDPVETLRAELPGEFPRWHPLNQAQYLEIKLLLAGYLLSSQGERMTMAHGVEGRYPFLDHRESEVASRIRPELKIKGLNEKYILKKTFAGELPREIFTRTKQPYGAPNKESFFVNGRLHDSIGEYLSPGSLKRHAVFDPQRVGMLVDKCSKADRLGFRDNSALVGILSTQILLDQFC
ncbi:MAG: asparagine synthase (glutamine-hydrolyzing) [Desulfomonilia bacterium]|nr:asparagine synthase (glutamine-hydrolyzing) [Desulfomonilia bacterium]